MGGTCRHYPSPLIQGIEGHACNIRIQKRDDFACHVVRRSDALQSYDADHYCGGLQRDELRYMGGTCRHYPCPLLQGIEGHTCDIRTQKQDDFACHVVRRLCALQACDADHDCGGLQRDGLQGYLEEVPGIAVECTLQFGQSPRSHSGWANLVGGDQSGHKTVAAGQRTAGVR